MPILTILLSILMIISSKNWLLIWIFFEINSMSFIMLISAKMNKESMMKYFIIQIMGSIPLLLLIMESYVNGGFLSTNFSEKEVNLLLVSLMIKMGSVPFHLWVIQISKSLSWKDIFMLLTVQKIAPLVVVLNVSKNFFFLSIAILNIVMGVFPLYIISNFKFIMAFSSISHLGWMMFCSMFSSKIMIFYLFVYSLIFKKISSSMEMKKGVLLNFKENFSNKSLLFIFFLSLGGIPPLIGFAPKAFVLISSLGSSMFFLIMIMLIFSVMSVLIYLKISMKVILMSKENKKLFKNEKNFFSELLAQLFFLPLIFLF